MLDRVNPIFNEPACHEACRNRLDGFDTSRRNERLFELGDLYLGHLWNSIQYNRISGWSWAKSFLSSILNEICFQIIPRHQFLVIIPIVILGLPMVHAIDIMYTIKPRRAWNMLSDRNPSIDRRSKLLNGSSAFYEITQHEMTGQNSSGKKWAYCTFMQGIPW